MDEGEIIEGEGGEGEGSYLLESNGQSGLGNVEHEDISTFAGEEDGCFEANATVHHFESAKEDSDLNAIAFRRLIV